MWIDTVLLTQLSCDCSCDFFADAHLVFCLIPAHCERRSSKCTYSRHVPGLKDDFLVDRSSCKKWSASYWKIKSAKVQTILDILLKIPSFVYYLCSSDGPDQAHILTLVHQLTSGSWPGSAQDSRNLETNIINGEWNKHTTTWSAVRKNCSFRFWTFEPPNQNEFLALLLVEKPSQRFEVRWLCWTKFTSHVTWKSDWCRPFRWCCHLSHSWRGNLPFAS